MAESEIELPELEALKEKMVELRKELLEQSKVSFKEISKVIFEKFPELKSFEWTQGTPSFNDGEPCEFGVHDVYINNEEEGEGPNYYSETVYEYATKLVKGYDYRMREVPDYSNKINERPNPDYNPRLIAASQACNKLVHSLDPDALMSMFGNGAKIIVTPEKVEAEEWYMGY